MGSARPELLANKEALAQVTEKALILAAAAGIEMAPAVDAVSASMNQFNLDASQSDRIINSIAAGSLAGSAEVGDLTESMKNVGTVANDSNMSLEQTVAALEVLGEKQLKGAEAGTKLRGALLKMKDAGVGYASGQFNVRDALVEVNAQINSHTSAIEKDAIKQKVFGIENITAGNILLQNIDKYDKLSVAVTDTNVAFEQAKTATSTNSAKLEQAKNRVQLLTIEFGEKLSPAMTMSTNAFAYFMKAVLAAIPFITQHARLIATVSAGIIAYAVASKSAAIWETIRQATITKGIFLSNLQAVAIRLKILLTNEATFAEKRALVATRALNAAGSSSPWGAIAAVIVMATMAIVNWVKESSKASVAQEAINNARERSVEMLMTEKSKVDMLLNLINSENVSLSVKKKAIEDLQKIIPGYTAMLDDQGKVIFQNTANVKEYINQLRKQFIFEATKEEFGKVSLAQAQAQEKVDELTAKYAGMKGPDTNQSTGSTLAPGTTTFQTTKGRVKSDIEEAKRELTDAQTAVDALNNKLESSANAMNDIVPKIQSETAQMLELNKAIKSGLGTPEELAALKEQLSVHIALRNGYINQQKGISPASSPGNSNGVNNGSSTDGESKKEQDKAAKTAEDAYKQQQEIKKRAVENSIALMQEGFDKELANLQAKFVAERETISRELENNKTLTVEQKNLLQKSLVDLQAGYDIDEAALLKARDLKSLKSDKDLLDLKLEGVRAGSAEEYQLKKEQLDKQLQIEIASVTGTEEHKQQIILALKAKFAKEQAKADEAYSIQFLDAKLKKDITDLNDAEQQKLDALKQKREAGQISQKEYNKQLIDLQSQYTKDSLTISIDKAQRELEILKAAGEDTTQAESTLAELRLKAQEAGTGKQTGATGGWDEWSTTDKLNMAVDTASQIADAEFQISRDKNQQELDEKLSSLQKEREVELSNKYLTESQKNAINVEYDGKEKAVKQDAWKKQHKADVAQAWVNLALGVGKAAINMWPVPAIPMMAAAAISGGLQVSAVTSQKMPQFSVGGYTATDSSNFTPVGVVHANEYVVPEVGVNNPSLRPVLNMIEVARQSGNLPSLNSQAIMKSLGSGFKDGGSTSGGLKNQYSTTAATDQQDSKRDLILVKALDVIAKLSQKLDSGIEATVAIRGRNGLYEKLAEDKQSQNNASL
jgi:TP901 family phage tail tape measure protein